jgi:hypothetical protein
MYWNLKLALWSEQLLPSWNLKQEKIHLCCLRFQLNRTSDLTPRLTRWFVCVSSLSPSWNLKREIKSEREKFMCTSFRSHSDLPPRLAPEKNSFVLHSDLSQTWNPKQKNSFVLHSDIPLRLGIWNEKFIFLAAREGPVVSLVRLSQVLLVFLLACFFSFSLSLQVGIRNKKSSLK